MANKPRTLPAPTGAQISVEIDLGGFVDIINADSLPGDARLCRATVTLAAAFPGVTQAAPNDPLVVTKKNVDLEFNIAAGSPYRLAGIAFKRIRGSGVVNGSKNMEKDNIRIFEDQTTGASRLRVKDAGNDHAKPPATVPSWELYLLVQDGSGSLGIVDPDVQNEF